MECKIFSLNFTGTDSAELNQYFYNGCSTCFDRLLFQVQTEKKQSPFAVTKLNIVYTGVFTYQPNSCDWITSTDV